MSTVDASLGGLGQRTRPNTRASIKALNFSSMGKALADVMHKESKESGLEKEKGKKEGDGPFGWRSPSKNPRIGF